jgi:hypothetical protein
MSRADAGRRRFLGLAAGLMGLPLAEILVRKKALRLALGQAAWASGGEEEGVQPVALQLQETGDDCPMS